MFHSRYSDKFRAKREELVAPDGRIKSLMFTFAYKVIGHMITGLD